MCVCGGGGGGGGLPWGMAAPVARVAKPDAAGSSHMGHPQPVTPLY